MKIICVGRNYAAHAKELNNAIEENPVIFLKPETALIRAELPFYYPSFSSDVHFETEIVVRIGKLGKNIKQEFASRYIDAISLGIDFTARDIQSKLKAKGFPWELAKSFDGSAPVGDFKDIAGFKDLSNINFKMSLNGVTRQDSNSSLMLFSIEKIISFVSGYITLKKGDYIFTGTPEGVGPVAIGDRLEAFLEGEKVLDLQIK